ncbi:MAG TPA: N-acetylneuraminate synthase family protein [Candidatus Omnitrophota bacterium]|nr:N-acetylneuraminate synthase family protein [Candidatus Omnitrophota bacterium]
MDKTFYIGRRLIGEASPPLVIAEVGINHNGQLEKAFHLVDAAIKAGAECIKFQCHITDAEMVKTDMKPGKISDETLWDIIKRCELSAEEEYRLKKYCDSKGILFLSTPFSREAADRLEAMGVKAFKIGSGECNNIPLIEHIARKKKPIILSTGMNNLNSIGKTVQRIKKYDAKLMLMHCTSMYPTPYDKVRLRAIMELKKAFRVPVGLSDHSLGIYTCLGAVALGACVLEKHFTCSKDWPGPDIKISIDPKELKDLVIGARAVFEARGGKKTILKEEKPVIDFAYASVCTISPVTKGERFTSNNVWVKRPGIGQIPASSIQKVLGKKSKRDIASGVLIKKTDIE